jgi:hypothetical protein
VVVARVITGIKSTIYLLGKHIRKISSILLLLLIFIILLLALDSDYRHKEFEERLLILGAGFLPLNYILELDSFDAKSNFVIGTLRLKPGLPEWGSKTYYAPLEYKDLTYQSPVQQ